MSTYETLGLILAACGALWGVFKYVTSYAEAAAKNAVATSTARLDSLQRSLDDIEESLVQFWQKHDSVRDDVLLLKHTAISEDRVRLLQEDYNTKSKADLQEVKNILNTIIEGVEALRISVAVRDAVDKSKGL